MKFEGESFAFSIKGTEIVLDAKTLKAMAIALDKIEGHGAVVIYPKNKGADVEILDLDEY